MKHEAGRERRGTTRFPVRSDVTVRGGENVRSGILSDLSLNGAYIRTKCDFEQFEDIRLSISVEKNDEQISTDIDAIVSRCDDKGIGVQFRNMDIHTFSAIKDIAEIYSREPARIEQDLRRILLVESINDGR